MTSVNRICGTCARLTGERDFEGLVVGLVSLAEPRRHCPGRVMNENPWILGYP